MDSAVINIRTDAKVKVQAMKVAEKLGFSLSGVMNGFLREFVKAKKIDFTADETPSPWLIKQLKAAEKDSKNDWVSPGFGNAEDAIEWLNNPKKKYVRDLQPEVYKTARKGTTKNKELRRFENKAVYGGQILANSQ